MRESKNKHDESGVFSAIAASRIASALSGSGRVYFTGHLEREQVLEHVDMAIETGKTRYAIDMADKPHMHVWNTEINFVVRGRVKVLLLSTGEERELRAGDVFIIEAGCPYATKGAAGSEVFFVKTPGGNDKRLLLEGEVPAAFDAWAESYDAVWDAGSNGIGDDSNEPKGAALNDTPVFVVEGMLDANSNSGDGTVSGICDDDILFG